MEKRMIRGGDRNRLVVEERGTGIEGYRLVRE